MSQRQTRLAYQAVKHLETSPRKRILSDSNRCVSPKPSAVSPPKRTTRQRAPPATPHVALPAERQARTRTARTQSTAATPRTTRQTTTTAADPPSTPKLLPQCSNEPPQTAPTQGAARRRVGARQTKTTHKRLEFDGAEESVSATPAATLIGRDRELARITSWLRGGLHAEPLSNAALGTTNISAYISGPPGTGKTACVSRVVAEALKSEKSSFTYILINCMALRQPTQLYKAVMEKLKPSLKLPAAKCAEELETEYLSRCQPFVLVLDECDQLVTKHCTILKRVYKWPFVRNSRLRCLIGISNSLDLTDRALPFEHGVIQRMHFEPYSAEQIIEILKYRLNEKNDAGTQMEDKAVELCARKVAAVTGDIRKALDIARVAVQRCEIEHSEKEDVEKAVEVKKEVVDAKETAEDPKPTAEDSKQTVQETKSSVQEKKIEIKESVATKPPPSPPTTPSTPTAGVRHVLRAVGQVYGARLPTALPLQQKIIVASMLALKRRANVAITLDMLYSNYRRSCASISVSAVDKSECRQLIDLIASQGLLEMRKQKKDFGFTVDLKLDDAEVARTLQDEVLLNKILSF